MNQELSSTALQQLQPEYLLCSDSDICIISGYYQPHTTKQPLLPKWLAKIRSNHTFYSNELGADYIFFSGHSSLPSISKDPFYLGCNSKPQYLLAALNMGYKHVFWIDSDSLILSLSSLQDAIANNHSITFTGDESDIANTGHLLLRNTQFAREFLANWHAAMCIPIDTSTGQPYFSLTLDNYCLGDQTTFNSLLAGPVKDSDQLVSNFNAVNGWSNNRARAIKNFKSSVAPFNRANINRAYQLLSPSNRTHIRILPQRSLNSYLGGDPRGLFQPGDSFIHFTYKKDLLKSSRLVRVTSNGRAHLHKLPLFYLYLTIFIVKLQSLLHHIVLFHNPRQSS